MNKLESISIAIFLLMASLPAMSQDLVYPAVVRTVFEKADAEVSAWYSGNGCEVKSHAQGSMEVTIAVPDCPEKKHLSDMVRLAGGHPLEIPPARELDNPSINLRALAALWDGALMPEGWVRKEDEYSVLFYKAVADRNVPCIGSSQLTKAIDTGLRRRPGNIGTMEELVERARTYRMAKEIMDGLFSIDTHCDLPDLYGKGYSVGKRSLSLCSVPKMDEGHLDSQVLISFLWQGPTDDASSEKAVERNFSQIERIRSDIAGNQGICGLATTPAEAASLKAQGKKAFFIGVENGYGIGNDLANIKKARDLGIVYITLCHFRDNAICNTSSRHGSDPSRGLTGYGRQVVGEMNRQGIMIDLSHPSPGTFWDCIRYSKAPIICSHSGAKAVFGHDRGLDDRQLKALAENGGVIQVYAVPEYLGRPRQAMTIDTMMEHFDHCVKVAGAEHVGIGCDFDGGGGVWGCNGDNDMVNITVKMIEHGYTPEQIKGFWGGNFMRVMEEVQSIAGRE